MAVPLWPLDYLGMKAWDRLAACRIRVRSSPDLPPRSLARPLLSQQAGVAQCVFIPRSSLSLGQWLLLTSLLPDRLCWEVSGSESAQDQGRQMPSQN